MAIFIFMRRAIPLIVAFVVLLASYQGVLSAEKSGPVSKEGPNDARANAAADDWWSFQPLKVAATPPVAAADWPQSGIDHFILSRLEEAEMVPAPPASRQAWIRRVTFDLTGLPPTPEEVQAFLSDEGPDAAARVIDRLLGSPHYGERWGRHWLDVVRYADTSGCNGDFPMPEAYRYRNYIIDSVNKDKPFDQLVREQIAGDLLPASSNSQRDEQIIATGYLAISRRFSSLGEEFHLTLDDTVDNFGKAFLGLSVSCARCHAHKFDPIPQEDYYALYGIFQSTRYAFPGTEIYRHPQDLVPLVPDDRMHQLRPTLERMSELDAEIFDVYSTMASLDTGAEKEKLRSRWKTLQEQRDKIVKELPTFDKAYAASEGEAVNAQIHVKGDPKTLGAEVPRGFLAVLGGQQVADDSDRSGRLELASWLTDPDNPLTARVIVNRVWQHHFGKGLVRTPNDFGTRGAVPTHPELLDWLTHRFILFGWSIKELHREILTSQAYQMAVVENPDYTRRDPDNELLWTFNARRLSAEEIRDAMLVVSGTLDRSQGGPHPFKPEWEWRYTQHNPFVDEFETRRRSIYLMQQRIRQQPYLAVFDGADTNASTEMRRASTTPQQALFGMNNELVHEQADHLARRLIAETASAQERVAQAIWLTLGRAPHNDEIQEAIAYVEALQEPLEEAGITADARARQAWGSYLRVLFNSNEFVMVD